MLPAPVEGRACRRNELDRYIDYNVEFSCGSREPNPATPLIPPPQYEYCRPTLGPPEQHNGWMLKINYDSLIAFQNL